MRVDFSRVVKLEKTSVSIGIESAEHTYAKVLVQRADALEISVIEVEFDTVQILDQTTMTVTLGNHGEALLRGPAEENLSGTCP